MIETLSSFDNVSSVEGRKAVSIDASENENEMQVLTQRLADNANRDLAELGNEMNEKLEKMFREVENIKTMQSISNEKNCEKSLSKVETPNRTNNKDGEINASDTDNQENEIGNNLRPSGTNELRTSVQPISLQYLD